MPTIPDHAWVEQLRSPDLPVREAASSELRSALMRNVRSQFLKRGLSEDCVEDVVQETVLRILNRLDTFRGDSQFMSWATAVGVRTGLELIRKQYWKTRTLGDFVTSDDSDLVGPWKSAEPDPHAQFDRREVLAVLSTAIQSVLTDRQRTVLLAEFKGMPTSEIAAELRTSRGAIYKIAHDARKKLKAEIERQGFDAHGVYSSINAG
jgi:RNA polymerase sigma-70 factor (ECF subfamily)